jgi:hypothetical protein
MKNPKSLEKEKEFLQNTDRPIIIWGTSTAGRMAYEVCCKLNIPVRAFGDNNKHKQGAELYGLEILPSETVKLQYPEAVIIVGTFVFNIENAITQQLSSINDRFSIIGKLWVEYYYELLVIGRKVADKKMFAAALDDVETDAEAKWRFNVNRGNIAEYKYIVTDYKCSDLYEIINLNYGIKNLYLIVSGRYLTKEFIRLVQDIQSRSNIGHINLVTDGVGWGDETVMDLLRRRQFFIIKLPDWCDAGFKYVVQSNNCHFDIENISKEVFQFNGSQRNIPVTERMVCECVCRYTGGKLKKDVVSSDRKVYIVQLFNGLANQMLMCLFGKMLEMESDRMVIFDDTLLTLDVIDKQSNIDRMGRWMSGFDKEKVERLVNETIKSNSFYCFERAEVAEVFKTHIRLLSDYFEADTWHLYLKKVKGEFAGQYIQSFPAGQMLLRNGTDICLIQDDAMPKDFTAVKNSFKFNKYILKIPYDKNSVTALITKNDRNTYYMGIWTMGEIKDWLFTNRDFAKSLFRFDVNLSENNLLYADRIKSTESVVIHIRRGDFILCNLETDNNFFKKAITKIEETISGSDKFYFVFSDDMDWCRNNSGVLGLDVVGDRVTYIDGNEGKNSYIDMYLISLGKILIPSYNSTFSYMAMLLSDSINKCVDVLQYRYYCREGIDDRIEIVDV